MYITYICVCDYRMRVRAEKLFGVILVAHTCLSLRSRQDSNGNMRLEPQIHPAGVI